MAPLASHTRSHWVKTYGRGPRPRNPCETTSSESPSPESTAINPVEAKIQSGVNSRN